MSAAEYGSAEDWAESLPNENLHCRDLGHSWAPHTASWDAKAKCYERTLRCSSCGTERRQILDRFGEVVKNGYSYVEGYLAKGHYDTAGQTTPRSTFRLAALQRATGSTGKPKRRRSSS